MRVREASAIGAWMAFYAHSTSPVEVSLAASDLCHWLELVEKGSIPVLSESWQQTLHQMQGQMHNIDLQLVWAPDEVVIHTGRLWLNDSQGRGMSLGVTIDSECILP